MAMQHSRDRCRHVVFLNGLQGHRRHTKTCGFKFSMACHECSNFFVNESHSVHVLQSLQLRYPHVTQEKREKTLPIIRSAWDKTFPLRAVTIVFLGQFDVLISPHFIIAPCQRFFPVSATLGIARAAHHLPSNNTNTSHGQGLHALMIVLLELTGNNDASTFHIVNPALIRFPSQTQDTTKLADLQNV